MGTQARPVMFRAWSGAATSGGITRAQKRTLGAICRGLRGAPATFLPPLITGSVILALLVGVHSVIGTPEILATVAVPWSVSTLYAIVYSAVLARGRDAATAR